MIEDRAPLQSPTSVLTPEREAERLSAVRRYDILDTPPDGAFDRITALAAKIFAVPISIISLVDHDRIWFKSHHGLDVRQIGRDPGLCASAILDDTPYILADAREDIRSLANPLVAGEFGLRFYMAVPLRTHDGHNLGTLCVIDREPRAVTEEQIRYLEDLAAIVMDQMELRLAARNSVADLTQILSDKDNALKRAEMMAKEIDHRVMNSLQFVSSILQMQGRMAKNDEAAKALDVAAARVAAVASVHRHFYSSDVLPNTPCLAYMQRLCKELSGVLGDFAIEVDGEEYELPTDQIVSLGLIVNELVTNAAKYDGKRAKITCGRGEDGSFQLRVSDEGAGLPADFQPDKSKGLGLKVVHSLIQKLGGALHAGNRPDGKGAMFTITFRPK
jgi:two-component sensor histidine kinase